MPTEPARKPRPRFNHVAISVPAELLDESGRGALLAFYGDVFGWDEMPTLTKDRELFVLRCNSNEQFVYLSASRDPMRCPAMDHFGMSVAAPAELDAMLERARKWKERDPEVEIVERGLEDYGFLRLHNFYVRYRLPLMIEVQCFEWQQASDARSEPASEARSEAPRAFGSREPSEVTKAANGVTTAGGPASGASA